MKFNKYLAGVFIALVGIGFVVTFKGQNSTQSKPSQLSTKVLNGREAKALDDAATPTADFDIDNTADLSYERREKNAKHDHGRFVIKDAHSSVAEVVDESQWAIGLSDLPADRSDLIVEGSVTAAKAFLSNDKTGIYSEFTIRISAILKASDQLRINPSDTVIAQRIGGKVKYKSGKVIRYRIEGQGSPIQDQAYIFFLRRTDEGDFRLLTAYELRNNAVFALDGSRINARGEGQWVFDKHNGENLEIFRQQLQKAMGRS
jgi:hypothetical protein